MLKLLYFKDNPVITTGAYGSIVSSPLESGGNDFCVISQAGGGATAKLQESGWGHLQGGR